MHTHGSSFSATAPAAAPGGFTLVELLVAIALVGLVGATLVPALLAQLSGWQEERLAAELQAVTAGAKLFRMDVGRWPGSVVDLVAEPAPGAQDLEGRAYPAATSLRWSGPYLERARVKAEGTQTVDGGLIQTLSSDAGYLRIDAVGLSARTMAEFDVSVDGIADPTAGRVRIASDSAGNSVLTFYAAPLRAGTPVPADPLTPPSTSPGGGGSEPEDPEPREPPQEVEPPAAGPKPGPPRPPGEKKKPCSGTKPGKRKNAGRCG